MQATDRLSQDLVATAKQTARELNREKTNGGLESYSKPELAELAASIGLKAPTSMTKADLVGAIN